MGLDANGEKSADRSISSPIIARCPVIAMSWRKVERADPGDTTSGNVLLAHVEGAPWNFLGIARYDSAGKNIAEGEKNSIARPKRVKAAGMNCARCALHHDTLTDRILP